MDDQRRNDRNAKRTLAIVGLVILIALAMGLWVLIDRREPPAPGGDLAPIPQAGGTTPAAGNGM